MLEYLDPDLAKKSGYPRPAPLSENDVISGPPRRSATKEEAVAFDGLSATTSSGDSIPKGGCAEEGRQKVYGSISDLFSSPRIFAMQARTSTMTDSRMQKAIADWRECMKGYGLEYDSPIVPPLDPRWKVSSSTMAGEEERRVASIDAGCQSQINIVGLYRALKRAYEQRLVDKNQKTLERANLNLSEKITTAKSIIAEGY